MLLTEQVMVSGITMTSAVVSWTVPSLTEQQMYYVEYGSDADSLNLRTGPIASDSPLDDRTYTATLSALDDATTYYVRVVATFSDVYLYSSTESFTTIAPRKMLFSQHYTFNFIQLPSYSSRRTSTEFQCFSSRRESHILMGRTGGRQPHPVLCPCLHC